MSNSIRITERTLIYKYNYLVSFQTDNSYTSLEPTITEVEDPQYNNETNAYKVRIKMSIGNQKKIINLFFNNPFQKQTGNAQVSNLTIKSYSIDPKTKVLEVILLLQLKFDSN